MRIAVNAYMLLESQSAHGRYLTQLLQALGMIDGVNDYRLLSPQPIDDRPPTPSTFVWESVMVNAPNDQLRRVRWEQRSFPDAAKRLDAKMLFVPYFAPTWASSLPLVTVVHDLLPFALPDYRPLSGESFYQRVVLTKGAQRATLIMTRSEFTKSEVIRLLAVPAERIAVVPDAPASHFRPVSDTLRLRTTRTKYGVSERFLLYVGGFEARKNVPMLIGAFAAAAHRIGEQGLQLLIVGDPAPLGSGPLYPDWRPLARKFGIEGRVVSAMLDESDLPALYSMTSGFVYPSLYEGHGLPVIEAMACGAPVIVSDQPALSEAVGSAGLTFVLTKGGEASVQSAMRSLTNQITRLMTLPEMREDYRQRSLARVNQYSWAQTAGEVSTLFAEVTGSMT